MNKEQLEKLSDFEINVEMCKSLGLQHTEGLDVVFAAGKSTGDNVTAVMGVVDYCNNWSDMGPLIDSNNLTLQSPTYNGNDYDYWSVSTNVDSGDCCMTVWCEHTNPLRAAAIVYLMMNEV